MEKSLQAYVLFISLFLILPLAYSMKTVTHFINEHAFELEVPVSTPEYNQGLMYRKRLQERTGMIFLFSPKKGNTPLMWMKNTYISLDMLFIGLDNRIACIIENTKPLSLSFLSCDRPVLAVIEINAGEVKKYNLKPEMEIKGSDLPKI